MCHERITLCCAAENIGKISEGGNAAYLGSTHKYLTETGTCARTHVHSQTRRMAFPKSSTPAYEIFINCCV